MRRVIWLVLVCLGTGVTCGDAVPHLDSREKNDPTLDVDRCQIFLPQIEADFADFPHEINEDHVREAIYTIPLEKQALLHINASGYYLVFKSPTNDPHISRCLAGIYKTFQSVWEGTWLPERGAVSVVLNFMATSEWPSQDRPYPILSYAKRRLSRDILIPRAYLSEFYEGRTFPAFWDARDINADMGAAMNTETVAEAEAAGIQPGRQTWEKKSMAVFRGQLTNPLRAELYHLARRHPSLLDVGITGLIPGTALSRHADSIDLVPEMDFADQASSYKYIVNVDGWGCADRLVFSLSTMCVTLWVAGNHRARRSDGCVEWYHRSLHDGVHFLSVPAHDLPRIVERIEWMRTNDEAAWKIALEAYEFANRYLTENCASWYLTRVLSKYSHRFVGTSQRTDGEQWLSPEGFTRVVDIRDLRGTLPHRGHAKRGVFGNL